MMSLLLSVVFSVPQAPLPPQGPPMRPEVKRAVATYAEVYARVKAGETLTISFGVDGPGAIRLPSMSAYPDGVYRCFPLNGEPHIERVSTSGLNNRGVQRSAIQSSANC